MHQKYGYTLIEILIVVSIIAVLAAVVLLAVLPARNTARDARRKADVSQIGRFLTAGCYVPTGGSGDYDLADVLTELKQKYPQYANYITQTPRDPAKGTAAQSYYRYIVDASSKKCSLYANLENAGENVTITNITTPTAGGGSGVWQGSAGWNGTDKYFQYGN